MNPNEPRPPIGAPRPSPSLPLPVRAWRRRLVRLLTPMAVLSHADGPALELLAGALAEYDANARVLLEHGTSYECQTAAGGLMRRARPEQAIAADAWRRASAMLAQFGLTPASRPKVEAIVPHHDSAASKRWEGLLDRMAGRSIAAFRRKRPATVEPRRPAS